MKRSQITIELIKDEINVVQAMDILNLLLQDIKDKKIKKWLENEIMDEKEYTSAINKKEKNRDDLER